MIKIDKRYTIKFSYAGIAQYADFNEVNGLLYNPSLSVNWSKTGEIPSVSHLTKIEDVLDVIKSFAYCKKAEIYLINGSPVFYYNKEKTRKLINTIQLATENFVKEQLTIFFNSELTPLIKKNNWKISNSHVGFLVLIEKDKDGNWDNIKDTKKEFEIEYLCAKCLLALNLGETIDIKKQHGNYIYQSRELFSIIEDEIKNTEFYLETPN